MSAGGTFDLGTYGAEITLSTSQFETGMANAETQLNNTEDRVKGFGNNLNLIVGGAIAGFGAAIVGAAVAGVKMSDELHKALNGLQSSTGATDDEMKGMEQSLKNIYNANFGQSFDDIAQSMAIVKQNTGLTGKELENTTKNALMLRDTFEMDVNETTNTANSLMKQFGITSQQAYNLIAQGAQNGANKNGDLLDSLNEYAPQFKAMGFSAEQFTNILIDGAKNGQFSIDKVGDAMKEFNLRSKDLSATTMDAYKSLGLNGQQMSASFAKGGENAQKAFAQVMSALNSVKSPLEQNRIGVELFGTQWEDLQGKGVQAFANIGKSASLSKSALEGINNVKYNSFGQALEGIKRNFQTALIDPMEKNVLPAFSSFSTWVNAHMPEIKNGINTALGDAAKVFNGLKDAVKFVIDNMNILLPVIAGVTGAVTAQMIINTVVGLYNKWKLATEAQTTVQWLLNAAMDANPIGVVALAIGGLIAAGVALYKNWDTVKSGAIALWDKLGNLKPMLLGLLGPFGAIVGAGIEVVKNWDTIIRKAEEIGGKIKDFFSNLKIHIPLPHFDFKTVTKNVAGISIPVPDVDVKWYANGGIVDEPTLGIFGEAGTEANIPLIGRKMDPFADAVYKRLQQNINTNGQTNSHIATAGNTTFNVNFNIDKVTGDQNGAKTLLSEFVNGVKRLGGTFK